MSTAGEYVYGTDGHEGHWLTGEEIVRCRDCKRLSLDNSDHDYRSGWWCHRWNTDMVKPDGFCAWGKRIVRCKDCVSSYRDEDGMWCCFYGTGFYRKPTDEGNYCSKGKRRDA